MDELEKIDAAMSAIRASTIRDAGRLNPELLEEVANDRREIEEHDARCQALRRPAAPPPPRQKTTEELDAEKQEREIQTRVRKALADLEAERQAAGDEE